MNKATTSTYNNEALPKGVKGTCPVCFNKYAVRNGRNLFRHGHKKTSWGIQRGSCEGEWGVALEVSDCSALYKLAKEKEQFAEHIETLSGARRAEAESNFKKRVEYAERTISEWQAAEQRKVNTMNKAAEKPATLPTLKEAEELLFCARHLRERAKAAISVGHTGPFRGTLQVWVQTFESPAAALKIAQKTIRDLGKTIAEIKEDAALRAAGVTRDQIGTWERLSKKCSDCGECGVSRSFDWGVDSNGEITIEEDKTCENCMAGEMRAEARDIEAAESGAALEAQRDLEAPEY